MDKMREEFELSCVSFKDEFGLPLPIVKDKEGCYISQITDRAWYFWQASRKALVVELPTAFPVSDDKDSAEVAYVLDILEKLALAGVSYK